MNDLLGSQQQLETDMFSQLRSCAWSLDLSRNTLTDEALGMLSLGLSDITNLRSLDISHNPSITQEGLQVLCAFAFGVHSGVILSSLYPWIHMCADLFGHNTSRFFTRSVYLAKPGLARSPELHRNYW